MKYRAAIWSIFKLFFSWHCKKQAKIKLETKIPEISDQKFKIIAENFAAELLILNEKQI